MTRLFLAWGLFWIGGTVWSTDASASACDTLRSQNSAAYARFCSGNGRMTAGTSAASSTFASSFNLSPATLPTEPSSYGLETIVNGVRSDFSQRSYHFSIVKGFKKFGTGISTGGNDTFYGNDIVRRYYLESQVRDFRPREEAQGHIANLNLGTSVSLLEIGKSTKLSLGGSLRYNKTTNSWGGGPGLLLTAGSLSLGVGYSREYLSKSFPRMTLYSALVGWRVGPFQLQYDALNEKEVSNLHTIHIGTLTTTIRNFILTGAVRRLNYVNEGYVTQYHAALQWLMNRHLSVGYLYNYIPGAHSMGVQIFL